MMKWIEEPGTVGQNVDQTCLQRCQDLAKLLPPSDQVLAILKCPAQCAIPAGGSAPPGTTPTTPTTAKKSSNTGLIVAGVVIGAIALAALAAS
jgi:hypothetical protein